MFKRIVKRDAGLLLIALGVVSLFPSSLPALAQANPPEAKWEADIKAYEASDKTNPPPKGAILFVGSSSIRMWKTLAQDFPNHPVINRGFGGSHLADSVAFADRIVIPYRPKLVLLYAGDNDIAAGKTTEQVFDDFVSFFKKVRSALPDVQIAYISIKPSIARWQFVHKIRETNRMIEVYSQTLKNPKLIKFIDVFTPMLGPDGRPRKELFVSDGLHLNAAGYELWASITRPFLKKE